MWVCEHEPDCTDQTRYEVTYQRGAILDENCNLVDGDPSEGEMVMAFCACCDAKATWVDQE
jgi:hypothetical protein